jgi:hypothetical protein
LLVFLLLGNVVVAEDEDPVDPDDDCTSFLRNIEEYQARGDLFWFVEVVCCHDMCTVQCYSRGGPLTCDILHYNINDYEEGCSTPNVDDKKNLFEISQSQQMYDHAEQQVDQGVNSGSHNSNIYRVDLGITFYRTISWEYDPVTKTFTDQLLVCRVPD